MNSVKYLQGTSFSQLTPASKTGTTNFYRAKPDVVISHLSSRRIQTFVRKFTKYKRTSGCAELTLYQALLINHSPSLTIRKVPRAATDGHTHAPSGT